MQHFADMDMRILADDHAILDQRGARLMLAGITDLSAPATGQPKPDLAAAPAEGPPDFPILLLDHQPHGARRAAARRRSTTVRTYAWRDDARPRSADGPRKCRVRVRFLRCRWHQAVCKQRYGQLARLRSASASPVRVDAHDVSQRVSNCSTSAALRGERPLSGGF
jgi:hypothetical protein